MVMENVTERHTTANEDAVVAMNCQSGDSNNNGSDNSGSYESPRMNSVTYYIRGGLEKVQMNKTPIIFLRKRYGIVVVRIQSRSLERLLISSYCGTGVKLS
jgi:hypothetical protein